MIETRRHAGRDETVAREDEEDRRRRAKKTAGGTGTSAKTKRTKPRAAATKKRSPAKRTRPSARHVMMSAALEAAAQEGLEYEGEDAPEFCNKGVAKGMPRHRAVEIFKAVYPRYPDSYIRGMNREQMCDMISHARVSEVTRRLCADMMNENASQEHVPQLISIAAALEGKPATDYRDMDKRTLCEIVADSMRVHQRFRFLRRLIPARVMNMIQTVVKRLVLSAGDASRLIMSIPAIEQIIDFMPAWVKVTLLGLGTTQILSGEDEKDRGWFLVSAIPMLFNLAGQKMPADLVAGMALLNPNRNVRDSAVFAGTTNAYVQSRRAARAVAQTYTDTKLKEGYEKASLDLLINYLVKSGAVVVDDKKGVVIIRYPDGDHKTLKTKGTFYNSSVSDVVKQEMADKNSKMRMFDAMAEQDAGYRESKQRLDMEYQEKLERLENERGKIEFRDMDTGSAEEEAFSTTGAIGALARAALSSVTGSG
eukprot:jgi/Mesvir1/16057/Mv08352-RA.1